MAKVHTRTRNAKRGGKIGTRGASFKDAPRPKSSRQPEMVTRFIDPQPATPVTERPGFIEDTGASGVSFERECVSRPAVDRAEAERETVRFYWVQGSTWIPESKNGSHVARIERKGGAWRRVSVVEDSAKSDYWLGASTARKVDKRRLTPRSAPTRGDKPSIGKVKPVRDTTPVFDSKGK